MPSLPSHLSTVVYDSALTLPKSVWDAFKSSPQSANVIYAHALKTYKKEELGEEPAPGQFWIVCSSDDNVELVLSCTENWISTYPIFIFSTRPHSQLTPQYVQPLVNKLVYTLIKTIPRSRVFSVFAPEPITNYFVARWSELTGIAPEADPYYAANLTYLTKTTFASRRQTIISNVVFDLRLAEASDLVEVAELCYGFAAESEPFTLTPEEAMAEAALMIENRQVWVHRITEGSVSATASIVCVTRTSDTVAAITKVYTNPQYRKRGCAERLVRRACKSLLISKEAVMLYVAHNNPAAAKVYHRVGFKGLAPNSPVVDGVDRWLEVGFDQSKVVLGHW